MHLSRHAPGLCAVSLMTDGPHDRSTHSLQLPAATTNQQRSPGGIIVYQQVRQADRLSLFPLLTPRPLLPCLAAGYEGTFVCEPDKQKALEMYKEWKYGKKEAH